VQAGKQENVGMSVMQKDFEGNWEHANKTNQRAEKLVLLCVEEWTSGRKLTMTNAGRRETTRSALLLLNVVRALAATTAQSVRLIIPLTESGGTLSYNHFLCCLRSTEMQR
jgi:hypothetical protein